MAKRQTGVRTPIFRRLMVAYGVSLFGDGIRTIALPLVAALLTESALAVAAVAAAELIPWLIFSVPVGALVDRWNPRTALLAAHAARAVLSAVLVAALMADQASVAVLCVLAFVLTVVETAADAASQIMLVNVAGAPDLLPANTRMRTVETILVNLAGPLVGGVLVAVSPPLAFAIDGATFVVAAGLVLTLPAWTGELESAEDAPDDATPTSFWASVVEGLTTLRSIPGLWLLVSVTAWTSLATGAVNALIALYALEVLGLPTAAVAVIFAIEAVGILVGAQLVGRLVAWRSDGVMMASGLFLVGGGTLVIGLVPVVSLVFGCYFVIGIGFAWWNVLASTRRQRLTPPGLLGRVSNASRAINWGSMPLGAGIGGLVGAALNLQSVWIGAGLIILITGVLARRPLVASGRLETRQATSL